jgi:long-chain acyl-CoA synthetase
MSASFWQHRESCPSRDEVETLLAHLLLIAREHPKRIALRCGSEQVTYEEFRARILQAAASLRALGVAKGDRVLICAGNTPVVPILYFAVHALGAIAAPVSPDTPESMLATLAADAEAKLAVIEKAVKEVPCAVASPRAVIDGAIGGDEIEPVCDAGSVADLLYTSGTTGRKKGVVLTHANILAAARNITEFVGNQPEDVEVVPLPLSHSFGLGRLRSLAVAGHTLVLEQGVGTGAPVVKRILETRATGFALVPAGFDIIRRMTGDVLGQAREHLRYIEIGSAAMKPETRHWLTEMLPNTRICHHYGLTEASRAAFIEYHSDAHKLGSVGRAAPNVEILVCDEHGSRLPTGETGEVVVRGAMVMREYWKQPDLTKQAFCKEGLKTGDIGCLDGDGYLSLLGRRSDLINIGGRKAAPDEIEDLLCQMEGVREAGCVGAPDELLGECVKAYLVADREIGRAEIVTFLRTRLEEWKIPQTVERIDSIPRTSSGKIQRQLLRRAKETEWTV